MVFFDQYKIETFDYEMFKKEYGENSEYLWNPKINFCPKEKFFIVNGCRFANKNDIIERKLVETSHKDYLKKIEYTFVAPTDTYVIFDFYLNSLHEQIDVSYILSHTELEAYEDKMKSRDFIKLNNRFSIRKKGYFIIFINNVTREKIYQLVIANNEYELENYINSFKIMGLYAKVVVSKEEMNNYLREYKRYTKGKLNKKEKKEITDLLGLPFLGKDSKTNLIDFIDSEIEKRIEESKMKDPETESEFLQREYVILSAKKSALLSYKSMHENYYKRMKEKEMLEDDGFYIESMLDEITLYRHNQNYFKNLLDLSFDSFIFDKNIVEKEYIKVHDELAEIEKERGNNGI